MRIAIVAFAAAGTDEIAVRFEMTEGDNACKESFTLSTDAYTRMGIERGECTREVYEAVEREAAVHKAVKRGRYILGYGACSRRMLISKLVVKGFTQEIAREAAARIADEGYLDEEDGARREAEKCAAKLWGEKRILATLREKRYSAEAIESAMNTLEDGGYDYVESCKRLVEKKYSEIPEDREERQKMIAALCRYGYSISQIREALE